MQRGPRLDGQDRRAHDLVDGARGQRSESFSLRANIRQERQPPVAPGDTIGVAATDQIAFADHPNQLQVRRQYGNGAYALLEQQDRGIAHAGPNQHGNDFLRHDLAGGVGGFDQNRFARFVSHGALSPREKARLIPPRAPWAWLRDVLYQDSVSVTRPKTPFTVMA